MGNIKVLGICTDGRKKNNEYILRDGKRIYGATGWYRIVNPLSKLGANIEVGMTMRTTGEDALRMKGLGDIWYMKMADNEGIDHIYGAHKDFCGAKIVLDMDDDIDNVDVNHPEYEGLKERLPMRERMVKMADHIVVSTEGIKQGLKHLNQHITIIPNSIDPKIWKYKNKKHNDGKIRIGWIASGSHFVDAPIIQDIMIELAQEYPNLEFHIAGMIDQKAEGDGWFHHKGTLGYEEFPKFYADMGIDIAIAPLKDIPFNRSKSNIKFLEAAMLEIPMVASDVRPYSCIEHGKTGYLATGPAQFKKYLKWLIENPAKREEIGKAAKKYVLDNWTIDKFLPKYKELFEKLMDKKDITVITAITGGKDDLIISPEYKGVQYLTFLDHWEGWVNVGETATDQPKLIKACDKFKNPVMNAKIHKILSHKYCDTPYIVWMDGNVKLKQDPHELVKLMGDKDFAFFKHPGWDSVYDEVERCVELKKGDVTEIAEQVRVYADPKGINFPLHSPHCEMTCFIRKNNPKTNDLFEKWWAEVCRYSERDQISFPVVFKGQDWATIPGSIVNGKDFKVESSQFPGNDYFKFYQHKK